MTLNNFGAIEMGKIKQSHRNLILELERAKAIEFANIFVCDAIWFQNTCNYSEF